MNLLETYSKRLKISEAFYNRKHEDGSKMSNHQKITVAKVLANTSAFLNEAFSHSVGTQRADLGTYKKFCLDLTTVALPSLIANDIVIVKPMTSMTGYIQYLQFTAGIDKGSVKQPTYNPDGSVSNEAVSLFNDPFKLGKMGIGEGERVDYTGDRVVELVAADATVITPAWTPVVNNEVIAIAADGTETTLTLTNGSVTVTAGAYTKVKYVYDNILVPAEQIPTLKAHMASIALEAKARRIAIFYSQMAAFQAKTETGIDLGEVLATQAVSEINYEIDTEVVALLYNAAKAQAVAEGHTDGYNVQWSKTLPVGVDKMAHYEGFAEVIEECSKVIYDRTQKHAANYAVVSSSIKPVLALIRGWKAAATGSINGPYFAGTLNGVKFYVSPALAEGDFFMGYNGDDLVTSAAVFAPYMAIVPTQLLGFADGGMSQGFSTLYDLKLLNNALLVSGHVSNAEA